YRCPLLHRKRERKKMDQRNRRSPPSPYDPNLLSGNRRKTIPNLVRISRKRSANPKRPCSKRMDQTRTKTIRHASHYLRNALCRTTAKHRKLQYTDPYHQAAIG